MDLEVYEKKIEQIEKELGEYYDLRLEKYFKLSEENFVAGRIINDVIVFIEELYKDIYMYELSLGNYNNGVIFTPQYYIACALVREDIIWERILVIVAVIYDIDISLIFQKKSIYPLYEEIKRNVNIDKNIKKMILDINGDSKLKELKQKRNINEHYISSHLIDNPQIDKEDIVKLLMLDEKGMHFNVEKTNLLIQNINKKAFENLRVLIPYIERKQKKYSELVKMCMDELENKLNVKRTITFKQKKYFQEPLLVIEFSEKYLEASSEVEIEIENIREKHRETVNLINKYSVGISDAAAEVRNNLLIDGLFRLKEVARSCNLYFCCIFYEANKMKLFKFDEENFKKFCNNDVVNCWYYYDYSVEKLYSGIEKIAKFILCKYDFNLGYITENDFKNVYSDKVCKLIEDKNIPTTQITNRFVQIYKSEIYQQYEKVRNHEYHRIRCRFIYENSGDIEMGNMCNISIVLKDLKFLLQQITEEERYIVDSMIKNQLKKR